MTFTKLLCYTMMNGAIGNISGKDLILNALKSSIFAC